jgi:DNA-binding MarR family transcriptional regulator
MPQLEGQTPTGVLIMAYLAEVGGSTDVSVAYLADLAGVSSTSVNKALGRLEKTGLIVVTRRRRNRYQGDPTGRTIQIAQA